jgi:hypothetical protein
MKFGLSGADSRPDFRIQATLLRFEENITGLCWAASAPCHKSPRLFAAMLG